jgi:hypothetical protein
MVFHWSLFFWLQGGGSLSSSDPDLGIPYLFTAWNKKITEKITEKSIDILKKLF